MKKTSSTSTRLADRYIRCDDFAARIDGVELAPEVWAVFAQLSEARNATELAEHLKLDIEAVNASLRRLVRRKLIRKHVLAWRDYAATTEPIVRNTNITPRVSAPASEPVIAPVARSPILSFRVMPAAARARPAPAISFSIDSTRPKTSPAPATPAPAGGLRLRPVLDAIGAKAGGGVAGQLLVYRVFLQIPTELMQAAGLHSLNLVDDQFTLRHPELRAALADTARRHAGVDIEALEVA
jgi:hypothetical protein